MFGIFASIAEFERELICDRVRSGSRRPVPRVSALGARVDDDFEVDGDKPVGRIYLGDVRLHWN